MGSRPGSGPTPDQGPPADPAGPGGNARVDTYNIFEAALPFGGYKPSGWGCEMGEEAIHQYTETKSVRIGL